MTTFWIVNHTLTSLVVYHLSTLYWNLFCFNITKGILYLISPYCALPYIKLILDKIASKPCYIMGDYNLDLLKHEIHHPTENVLDIIYANYLVPLINRPTRITRESSTLIDNIFSNNYNFINYQVNGILYTDISYHYIIFHLLSLKVEKPTNDQYKIVRVMNTSRTQRYIERIRTTDWSILESCNECHTYFLNFLKIFKNIYDECFPMKKVKAQYSQIKSWWIDVLRPWAYALGYLNGWVMRVLRHCVWRHAWRNLSWDVTCDVAVSPCTQVYNGNNSGKYSGIISRYDMYMVFKQLVQISCYSFLLFPRFVLFCLRFVCLFSTVVLTCLVDVRKGSRNKGKNTTHGLLSVGPLQ